MLYAPILLESAPSTKILFFFLVWLGLWLPIAIPLGIALHWKPFQQPIAPQQKLPLLGSLYLLAPLVIWGSLGMEHRPWQDYGWVWSWGEARSILLGLGLGILGLGGLFGVQKALGWLNWHFDPVNSVDLVDPMPLASEIPSSPTSPLAGTKLWRIELLALLGLAVWVSITEELVFRGFLLTQLEQTYVPWLAATIASLIFALLHLVWEGQETLPQLPGLALMGIVLCLARWVDGDNLGLAIGLHSGWVWTIASLDSIQAITYTKQAPAWLTGYGGKPLAGVMGLGFLLGMGLLLWGWMGF